MAEAALERGILATHQALYDAIETGDLDLMESLWLPGEDTVCIFPGAEPVNGTAAIVRSWAMLMAQVGYVQFILTDVVVRRRGDVAVVTCTENVLAEAGAETEAVFTGGRGVASDVLVSTPGGWRLLSHHAGPVVDGEE
ncbi:SnoaL-like protein [Mumia flava]|uniref:SnoaL-like protein n=1 Tax=Mumia flava TaxID=1348852 RepID=A0A0B2BQT6_9ACTN|nr:nuclear transport factor 2 family protein [Mumia flava]PJJ58100.1 SnoaL-like protein [Mumia flava]